MRKLIGTTKDGDRTLRVRVSDYTSVYNRVVVWRTQGVLTVQVNGEAIPTGPSAYGLTKALMDL